jgi:hypothetical protein
VVLVLALGLVWCLREEFLHASRKIARPLANDEAWPHELSGLSVMDSFEVALSGSLASRAVWFIRHGFF